LYIIICYGNTVLPFSLVPIGHTELVAFVTAHVTSTERQCVRRRQARAVASLDTLETRAARNAPMDSTAMAVQVSTANSAYKKPAYNKFTDTRNWFLLHNVYSGVSSLYV